jgi:SAM-dependent methyltransferase
MKVHRIIPIVLLMGLPLARAGQEPQPISTAQTWNAEFEERAKRGIVFTPNAFLGRVADKLTPGTAVDIAMGQGRNALMLAERGWDVTGFDISDVAVRQALDQAKARGLKLNAVVAEGGEFDFGADRWDLVVSIYAGVTRFDDVLRSLKPGGVWVVEAFHRDSFGGGFTDNELVRLFADRMTIQYYEDSVGQPDLTWIYPPKDFRYVHLVARKMPVR